MYNIVAKQTLEGLRDRMNQYDIDQITTLINVYGYYVQAFTGELKVPVSQEVDEAKDRGVEPKATLVPKGRKTSRGKTKSPAKGLDKDGLGVTSEIPRDMR